MAIRIMQTKGGYSNTTANKYVKLDKAIHSVSTELEHQQIFDYGKPNRENIPYKDTIIQ